MKKAVLWSAVGPAATGVLVSALLWERMPDPMPIHWGADGLPNGWAPRAVALLLIPVIGLGTSAFTTVAFRRENMHRTIVPMNLGLGGFLLGVHALMLHAVVHPEATLVVEGVFLLTGLLFAGIGLAMPHIRQNRVTGIRTPWTLSNETNWVLTHRVAAWTMTIGGSFSAITAIVLPKPLMVWVAMGLLLGSTLVPFAASYVIHRHQHSHKR